MTYKIRISTTVDEKLTMINHYCISNFNNCDYGYLLYSRLLNACDTLSKNPKIGVKYSKYTYRLSLFDIKYNLYYSIENDTIYIEDILAFKEYQ